MSAEHPRTPSTNFLRQRLEKKKLQEQAQKELTTEKVDDTLVNYDTNLEALFAEFQDLEAEAMVEEADEDVLAGLIFKSDLEEEPEWKIPNQEL